MNEVTTLIPSIDVSAIEVTVYSQNSLNSYTIQTTIDSTHITAQINYDITTNKTYVTNYKE